jgi:hypothetical protein
MAIEFEVVVNVGVDRREILQRLHLSEPQHGSFSSSERQVAFLRQAAHLMPPADSHFSPELMTQRPVTSSYGGAGCSWWTSKFAQV